MLVITVVQPDEIKAQTGPYSYKAHHNARVHCTRHLVGSFRDKFDQRQRMALIEATVQSLEVLDCNGTVSLGVEGGSFVIEARFRVINESCKEIIEKAFSELDTNAQSLSQMFPKANFSLQYSVVTTFSDVVAKPG